MRNFFFSLVFTTAAYFFASDIFAKESEPHQVILISIDGLRPDFYTSSSFEAPFLKSLASNNLSAEGVKTIFPSVTYPAHTSMVTGAYPDQHGIVSNQMF